MTFRGFIAVDVPGGPVLDALAEDLEKASPSLNVVGPHQLHLTVKFLGDTEEGLVPQIVIAINEATTGLRPFQIRVRGTGAFPSLGRMNVVWVGVEGAEPIARVADSLEASLERLGFPRGRPPREPHVPHAPGAGGLNPRRLPGSPAAHATEDLGAHPLDSVPPKQ